MSQSPTVPVPEGPSPPLGVMDAVGMAWRTLMAGFWPLWLVGLVYALLEYVRFNVSVGSVAFSVGWAVLWMLVEIFFRVPLTAGLYWAVGRRLDTGKAGVGDLFQAFRACYGDAILARWPVLLISVLSILFGAALAMAYPQVTRGNVTYYVNLGGFQMDLNPVTGCVVGLGLVLTLVVSVLLVFSLVALWERPHSGGEAIRRSIRLVGDHLGSVIGLVLLFALIFPGAAVLGALACCVGLLITIPAAELWWATSLVLLYRSWTGRPLRAATEPEGGIGTGPAGAEGPIPPTDIESPRDL